MQGEVILTGYTNPLGLFLKGEPFLSRTADNISYTFPVGAQCPIPSEADAREILLDLTSEHGWQLNIIGFPTPAVPAPTSPAETEGP